MKLQVSPKVDNSLPSPPLYPSLPNPRRIPARKLPLPNLLHISILKLSSLHLTPLSEFRAKSDVWGAHLPLNQRGRGFEFPVGASDEPADPYVVDGGEVGDCAVRYRCRGSGRKNALNEDVAKCCLGVVWGYG